MTENGTRAYIVVNVEHDAERLSDLVAALERRGILVEIVGQGRQLRRSPAVVLKIASQRAAEALLALELEGFDDALAYNVDES